MRERYQINLVNLKNKEYHYQFEVNDAFFSAFEDSLVKQGQAKVEVHLEKTETMLRLLFDIQGSIMLICDRSLDEFEYPLQIEEQMIFKFGEENEVISEDMEIISWNTVHLNLAQLIYEYIGLAVPMKKLHPRYKEEDSVEEESFIYRSGSSDTNDANSEATEIDPRWEKLKNLKK